MKVLFIGATGVVGSQVVPLLAKDFDLTLAAFGSENIGEYEVKHLDVTDWEATLNAIEGNNYDAIVNCAIASHLNIQANDPDHLRRYFERCIDVNARGAYHVYEAAARCGVPRCVYISSMTTVMGTPMYDYIEPDAAPRPVDLYSATKLFGEQLGETYAHRQKQALKVLCLRLGQPYVSLTAIDEDWSASELVCSLMVHHHDMASAISCALTADVGFGVYPIISQNSTPWIDTSRCAEIDYRPQWHFSPEGIKKVGWETIELEMMELETVKL